MIAVSLLLIAGAVTLLVLGLWLSSSAMLGASIAASLVAAVLLVVGARRSAPGPGATAHRERGGRASHRERGDRPSHRERGHRPWQRERGAGRAGQSGAGTDATRPEPPRRPEQAGRPERAAPPPRVVEPVSRDVPASPGPLHNGSTHVTEPIVRESPGAGAGPADDLDPPDEPAPQPVSSADAARVGRMATEVLVVDGRPRYHLPGCVHLLGRESEPLPVREAIELGFSPCGLCEPDSALLEDVRRV